MESDNKEKTPRPNIFVSLQVPGNENTLEYLTKIRTLQVDSEDIQRSMKEFQESCLDKEPKLKTSLVSPKKAHITLLVFHVEDERLEEAKLLFEEICQNSFSKDDIFDVRFEGVGSFGTRVLFAKPTGNIERMIKMSEVFQSKFSEEKFPCDFKLQPHLTLMKVRGRSKELRKIPRSSHSDLKDYNFGVQSFETIQLLSMTKPESEVIIFLLKLNCVLITASLGTTTVRRSSGSMTKKAKKFEECPIYIIF